MRLENKSILITAAAQGMGKASAIACANEGATVYATDINGSALAELAKENQNILAAILDATDYDAIEEYTKGLPDLDGLFNCAGFVHHGTIMDISEEDWAFSLSLNVTSMLRVIKAVLPGMLNRANTEGSAAILNMSSMASSIKGFPVRSAYGTTKAAVIGLTKSVAADYVKNNLRCNALCPGTVDTPSLRERIANAADPAQAERDFIARQPMGRLATVDDITPLVVYLLSDESRFVTGQGILVDGGVTI